MSDTEEMKQLRGHRNMLLTNSDWTVMPDSPLSDSKQTEWKTYRQALRDLPASSSPNLDSYYKLNLTSVTWPTKPS